MNLQLCFETLLYLGVIWLVGGRDYKDSKLLFSGAFHTDTALTPPLITHVLKTVTAILLGEDHPPGLS